MLEFQYLMPKVFIPQKNITLIADKGENLMAFLRKNDVPVASSCLGDGICGKCKMFITGTISEKASLEKETLLRNKALESERLSCQISISADLEVRTTYW